MDATEAQTATFAGVLRSFRDRAGLTQKALAEHAGLSYDTIYSLESGKTRGPRRETIDLLADVLKLKAEERDVLERTAERGRVRTRSVSSMPITVVPKSTERRTEAIPTRNTVAAGGQNVAVALEQISDSESPYEADGSATPDEALGVVVISATDHEVRSSLAALLEEQLAQPNYAGESRADPDIRLNILLAAKGHQIARELSALDPQVPHELIVLWGYHVAEGEPARSVDSSPVHVELEASIGVAIAARDLTEILNISLPPNVRLVLVASRGSSAIYGSVQDSGSLPCPWADSLVSCAPYVLAAEWPPRHPAPELGASAQIFVSTFLASYARTQSIYSSLSRAQVQMQARSPSNGARVTLLKRARYNADGAFVIDAKITGFPDPITLDLTRVRPSLAKLGWTSRHVLDMLARKIRAHIRAYDVARERAILPIDHVLYGEFSWDPSARLMTCLKIFRFSDDVSDQHSDAWCTLLVKYDDLCAQSYRTMSNPGHPTARTVIAQSLARFNSAHDALATVVTALAEAGCRQVRYPYGMMRAYLDTADEKLIAGEYGEAVAYLEMALSTLHDMVDMCRPTVIAETHG